MTSTVEGFEGTPERVGEVTITPGAWHRVHVRGEAPGPKEVDARMVTEVFHANTGAITLAVYSDGSVAFEGPSKDYPADGWRARWVPFEDSMYQQYVQSGR